MQGTGSIILGVLMLAAFGLVLGGLRLLRTGERRKGTLMLVCAAVFVANVLILTI